jgi:hypothetical protein
MRAKDAAEEGSAEGCAVYVHTYIRRGGANDMSKPYDALSANKR